MNNRLADYLAHVLENGKPVFRERTCANRIRSASPTGMRCQLGNFTKGTNIMTMNKLLRCGIGLGLLLAAGPLQAQQAALKIRP